MLITGAYGPCYDRDVLAVQGQIVIIIDNGNTTCTEDVVMVVIK